MEKSITTSNMPLAKKQKRFFEIEQGSNYLIATSFNQEYIVEFEQFQNISNNLFNTDADFITINKSIIQRKYIQKIEPTKQLTPKQKELKSNRREKERQEHRAKYGADPLF